MGPIERFFAALAGAVTAAVGPAGEPAQPPPTAIEIGAGIPDGTPPLPEPRPLPETLPLRFAAIQDLGDVIPADATPADAAPADIAAPDPAETAAAPAQPTPYGPLPVVAQTPAEAAAALAEAMPPLRAPLPEGDMPDTAFAFALAGAPFAYAPGTEFLGFDAGPQLDFEPPPTPEPNPLAVGEIQLAALPPAPLPATPSPQHDRACLSQLAALSLTAEVLPPINGAGACGVSTPVDVEAVGAGRFEVDLIPAAVVDCSVVGALTQWLEEDVQPAAQAHIGQWVTGIRVAASYACRGRNNDPNAQLSEHAFGNAIDISAFRFEDGTWLEVQPFSDSADPRAAFLSAVRADACGPFTTVLGPGIAYHDDHLHFDLASRGQSGRGLYCH